VGAARDAALAARTVIVTVEEIIDVLPPALNSIVLPYWVVKAVVHCPAGAYPSYAHGYYERDNAFYQAWDAISRDRDRFFDWMDRHVLKTSNPRGFLTSLKSECAA
jgi:glutaconate CoA-transferase subunit A